MGPEELMDTLDKAKARSLAKQSAEETARAKKLTSAPEVTRALNSDEQHFVDSMSAVLPPIIARKEVPHYLGGIVSPSALASADSAGRGPEVTYKIGGRMVAYSTSSLLKWVAIHFGITRLRKINHL